MEVSVLMPARDAAATVDAAVASVLASRGVDLELLCVEDGSRDTTRERLDAWAARDRRVRIVPTARRGLVPALNAGLAAARAPRVARMDADDEMHPDRLRAQVDHLCAHPDAGLVGTQVESFRCGGLAEGYRRYSRWANALIEPDALAREAFIECPVPHPTWAFDRPLVAGLGGYRERGWPEDLDLLYRVLESGRGLAKLPRVLHRWRDHPQRLSRVDPRYGRDAFSRVKAHFVGRLHPMPGAVVWGAGRTGRRLVPWLQAEGVRVRALIDLRPGRSGKTWRGLPIHPPEEVPRRAPGWRGRGWRVLAAVAARGAREPIRAALEAAGLCEGRDFLMLA